MSGGRSTVVVLFAVVEVDRLLGSVARLTGNPLGLLHPRFGGAVWTTSFDLTGIVIAAASLVFARAQLQRAPWARSFGTVTLVAAAHHTLLLLALALGAAVEAHPVLLFAYVATSVPILILAALHCADTFVLAS